MRQATALGNQQERVAHKRVHAGGLCDVAQDLLADCEGDAGVLEGCAQVAAFLPAGTEVAQVASDLVDVAGFARECQQSGGVTAAEDADGHARFSAVTRASSLANVSAMRF